MFMSSMLQDALQYATEAHYGQKRKGKDVPYIVHPAAVGRKLEGYGCDDAVVAAGFLHDTVEDTDVTLSDVEEEFGPYVAELVDGASEHDKDAPWLERKEHTIAYLQEAPEDVLLVTTADKLDNVQSMDREYDREGEEMWDRFNSPSDDEPFDSIREKQEWYYTSIVSVLEDRLDEEPGRLLYEELRDEVDEFFDRV